MEKKRLGLALCGSYCTYAKLFAAAEDIGRLLNRKSVFFVPFGQDDPAKKPRSLQADFSLLGEAVEAALRGEQLQPILK